MQTKVKDTVGRQPYGGLLVVQKLRVHTGEVGLELQYPISRVSAVSNYPRPSAANLVNEARRMSVQWYVQYVQGR